ncbi:metal-dependent phosphohydrolase [Yinghuangia sp. ASG 101]|nr:metal-dependent phosphohydrolase [Yinghuangia sp. ASG 101]UGQ15437.1 metal-dependent phosphohydrolase [Yinghuangia sp. ASG 101]
MQERWARLVGGSSDATATAVGDDLIDRYSQPHRRYHATGHLLAVLTLVDDLADDAEDADAVRFAAWFHDAVYDPARADNEERSARLAERALPEAGVAAPLVAEAARLVRVTAEHSPMAGDLNAAVLCDADLAILGTDRATYERYAAAVREEYSFVPDEAFRPARAAVLRDLLSLPKLFHTETGFTRYENPARANLRAELESLESTPPHSRG